MNRVKISEICTQLSSSVASCFRLAHVKSDLLDVPGNLAAMQQPESLQGNESGLFVSRWPSVSLVATPPLGLRVKHGAPVNTRRLPLLPAIQPPPHLLSAGRAAASQREDSLPTAGFSFRSGAR